MTAHVGSSQLAIERPSRVYFDTAYWQDRASEDIDAEGRRLFSSVFGLGLAVPVLSTVHCIEIAKKSIRTRTAITNILEPLVNTRRVMWVARSHALMRSEWRERADGRSGRVPDALAFSSEYADVMDVPAVVRESAGAQPDFATLIAVQSRMSATYKPVSSGLSDAMAFSQRRRAKYPRDRRRYASIERLSRALSHVPPDVWDAPSRPGFSAPIDLDAMPANRIALAFEEGNDLANDMFDKPDPTHSEDFLHLGSAVYCDIAFVDSKTHDKLARGKYCPAHILRNGGERHFLLSLLNGAGQG